MERRGDFWIVLRERCSLLVHSPPNVLQDVGCSTRVRRDNDNELLTPSRDCEQGCALHIGSLARTTPHADHELLMRGDGLFHLRKNPVSKDWWRVVQEKWNAIGFNPVHKARLCIPSPVPVNFTECVVQLGVY